MSLLILSMCSSGLPMAATGLVCAAATVALKPPWGCIAFLLRKDRTDIADESLPHGLNCLGPPRRHTRDGLQTDELG